MLLELSCDGALTSLRRRPPACWTPPQPKVAGSMPNALLRGRGDLPPNLPYRGRRRIREKREHRGESGLEISGMTTGYEI